MADPRHDPRTEDSLLGLLSRFFPGTPEMSAFAIGLAAGSVLLLVFVGLGFLIGGQHGITTPVLH